METWQLSLENYCASSSSYLQLSNKNVMPFFTFQEKKNVRFYVTWQRPLFFFCFAKRWVSVMEIFFQCIAIKSKENYFVRVCDCMKRKKLNQNERSVAFTWPHRVMAITKQMTKKKRKSFVGELSSVNTFCFLSLFRRFLHVLVTVLAPFTFRSLYSLGFFCQRWWIHRHITCALSTCWFKGEIFWIGTKNKKLQQTKIGCHEMLFFHYSVSLVVRGRHREQIKFA